jgi:hypothetical protein
MGPQALRTGYKIDAYRHFSPHEAQYSVHHPRWPENRGLVCVICPWCVSLLDSGNFGLADAQFDARREFDLSPRALLSADREALKRALFVILHFQVLQPHCIVDDDAGANEDDRGNLHCLRYPAMLCQGDDASSNVRVV